MNASAYFADLQKRVQQEMGMALNTSAKLGVRLGQDLSKGPYSQALLDAMGHPYARRRPRPPLPTFVINYQTGNFYRGWAMQPVRKGGSLLTAFVQNRTPEADELDKGTIWAIRRPIRETVTQALSPILKKQIGMALRRL